MPSCAESTWNGVVLTGSPVRVILSQAFFLLSLECQTTFMKDHCAVPCRV